MKNVLVIALLLFFVAGTMSAKKKNKVPEIKSDTAAVIAPDSIDEEYSFPMISIGNVSFLNGAEVVPADSIPFEQLDSTFFQGLSKKEIVDFFVSNVVYPIQLKQKAAEDFLKIRFDVDKNGKVKNPKVVNSKFPEMEKEVLRVVSKLPDYVTKPSDEKVKKSKRKNKEKDTTVEVPISFRLLKL